MPPPPGSGTDEASSGGASPPRARKAEAWPPPDAVSDHSSADAEAAPPAPAGGLAAALAACGAVALHGDREAAVEAHARAAIAAGAADDLFYVVDLGLVARLHAAWAAAMPRVAVHYAVKSNPDPGMLRVLAALGAGFDCASEAEIAQVLALGVAPERVVYAHPCKPPGQLRWAAACGVDLTTFDSESELRKCAAHAPRAGLLLRLRADDPAARCPLGPKYGAEAAEVPALLALAAELGLRVRGVAFHVGSGAKTAAAFYVAVAAARAVFDAAAALGFRMDVLDIGGGFSAARGPGGAVGVAHGVPTAVNAALDAFFPDDGRVRVIAEPGRYFCELPPSLLTAVHGWRARPAPGGGPGMEYWIADGVYGSMNCILYDSAVLATPAVVRSPLLPAPAAADERAVVPSTLFGPTCDSMDVVLRGALLPCLRNGDWLAWHAFGAYTIAGAVNFNGFSVADPKRLYVFVDEDR